RLHLFGGVARLRRGAADCRDFLALAAGAAVFGGRRDAHGRQGVPAGPGRPDRRVARILLHRPRASAGRDRISLPAAAVPETPAGAARNVGRDRAAYCAGLSHTRYIMAEYAALFRPKRLTFRVSSSRGRTQTIRQA